MEKNKAGKGTGSVCVCGGGVATLSMVVRMASLRMGLQSRDLEVRKWAIWMCGRSIPGRGTTGERTWLVQSRARMPVQLRRKSRREHTKDKVKEVRRPPAQSHYDLGFSKMGSAMGGLGAEGWHDPICGLQDTSPGCVEKRLQEKQVEKQETCQEVMAAIQAGDDNSLDQQKWG